MKLFNNTLLAMAAHKEVLDFERTHKLSLRQGEIRSARRDALTETASGKFAAQSKDLSVAKDILTQAFGPQLPTFGK